MKKHAKISRPSSDWVPDSNCVPPVAIGIHAFGSLEPNSGIETLAARMPATGDSTDDPAVDFAAALDRPEDHSWEIEAISMHARDRLEDHSLEIEAKSTLARDRFENHFGEIEAI